MKVLKLVQKSVNDAIKTINKSNNNIVWPASTINGPERTKEKVLEIVEKIENGDILNIDEAKGVVGRSLLLDIPYFKFVFHVPAEYLHSVCLGVVKRTVSLTFNVGESKPRNTARKLSSVEQFNSLMSKMKGPREFSRRARNLDFSVMKGQEFRNLVLFYFPLIIECIEETAKERRLWLLLAYLVRACILPNNEYDLIDVAVLRYCGKQFYELYEKLFHARNCTLYTHTVSCHLPEVRVNGPLTETSAFGFESFYGELRHSFTPGTMSPLKQIMQKVLLKRSTASHSCKAPIYYSPKDTQLECNSLVYTFSNNEYQFYQIISVQNNILECYKVGKYEKSFPETPTLNWAKVGVFEVGGISDEKVEIVIDNIAGKIIKVNDLFITCPNNILEEK